MPVSSWSPNAGSNTGILSGLTLDGTVMTVPQIDNAFRDMAAQIAAQLGKVNFKGADVSSASPDLSNATGWYVDISGTTAITALGTVAAGQMSVLHFTGALTFTHNASSLILPGGADITTANGDVAFMVSLGSGSWRCISYLRASAGPITDTLTLISTDAGAAAGPVLTLYRNSSTPDVSDIIGKVLYQGEDSAGNTEDYAETYTLIVDPTSTSEDASYLIRIKVGGTMTDRITLTAAGAALVGNVTISGTLTVG